MGKKKWLVVVGTLVVLAAAIGIYASVNKFSIGTRLFINWKRISA